MKAQPSVLVGELRSRQLNKQLAGLSHFGKTDRFAVLKPRPSDDRTIQHKVVTGRYPTLENGGIRASLHR